MAEVMRYAEMKDSGVEWIGMMPRHWKSCSLKYLCSMQAGKNLTSEQITDDGTYPVYGGNGSKKPSIVPVNEDSMEGFGCVLVRN